MNIEADLKSAYPNELVDAVLLSYGEIETNFCAGKWKASELDSGHFVEGVRRIIESRLFGSYTAIGHNLPNFHDGELRRYEQANGDESFRILIPRALKSIYGIRNKRGVGHLGPVSPNEMDSLYILGTAKWVLAELLRLASNSTPAQVQEEISRIVERRIPVLWKQGDISRVLDSRWKAREQVLIHLYDQSPQKISDLMNKIEYKNKTNFMKIMKRLHASGLIHLAASEDTLITPLGIVEVERLLNVAR